MNRLATKRRAAVVAALVEGNSLRATARMTGVARMTVEKLLRDLGAACAKYQDETLRELKCKRVQCDEILSFVYAKEKNVTEDIQAEHPDAGDVWTWTAIDADSKLCVSYRVGNRDRPTAKAFMQDLESRLANRIQLTTDQFGAYMTAVDTAFIGVNGVDFAMLQKIYKGGQQQGRYSPPVCIGCKRVVVEGDPDPKHISTSYVERQNLNMRMTMRRFTRLTNAFSKKVAMLAANVSLHFMYYNFAKIHQTLRVTPAMEAGVCDHAWEIEEIVALLDRPLA